MLTDLAAHLDQIVSAPDHLWLRWLFILAGLALIGWGAWRAGDTELSALSQRNEILASEGAERNALIAADTAAREDAANRLRGQLESTIAGVRSETMAVNRLGSFFAKVYLFQNDLDRVRPQINEAWSALNAYAELIRKIEAKESPGTHRGINGAVKDALQGAVMKIQSVRSLVLGSNFEFRKKEPEAILTAGNRATGEMPTFRLEENGAYLDAHLENLAQLRRAMDEINEAVKAKQNEVVELQNTIKVETEKIHGRSPFGAAF